MTLELYLADEFGRSMSDGSRAYEYRRGRLDPYVDISETIVIDFTGVRSANSSFVNALVAGAVEQHGDAFLTKVKFKGCSPVIRVLVESAISLGCEKHARLHHA